LKTVVDRRVDHVHAGFDSFHNCVRIRLVGARVRLSEIRPDSERGKPQALLLVKVPLRGAPGKSRGVSLRAIRCRKRGHFTSQIEERQLYSYSRRTRTSCGVGKARMSLPEFRMIEPYTRMKMVCRGAGVSPAIFLSSAS